MLADLRSLLGRKGRTHAGRSERALAVRQERQLLTRSSDALMEDGVACLHVRLDDWIMPASERKPGARRRRETASMQLPGVSSALRSGTSVRAPGYDAATRGGGQ